MSVSKSIPVSTTQIVIDKIMKPITNVKGSVGDRYLLLTQKKISINEYDGSTWNIVDCDSRVPTYVHIINSNTNVIMYHDQLWDMAKYFICDNCIKVHPINVKSTKNDKCIYCYFMDIYDAPNRDELDIPPMTIGQFIKTYHKTHKGITCLDPSKCFLCKYNSGELLFDIKNPQLIYGNNMIKLLQQKKITILV
jgi:hypothetical protein